VESPNIANASRSLNPGESTYVDFGIADVLDALYRINDELTASPSQTYRGSQTFYRCL